MHAFRGYGVGLGIGDTLSFMQMTLAAIAIFAAQSVASRRDLRDPGRDAPPIFS